MEKCGRPPKTEPQLGAAEGQSIHPATANEKGFERVIAPKAPLLSEDVPGIAARRAK
jgi:hypothetical protein